MMNDYGSMAKLLMSPVQQTAGEPLSPDMLQYILTESQRLGMSPEALISQINRTMTSSGASNRARHMDNPFLRSRVLGK